jgi:hypothetical protein
VALSPRRWAAGAIVAAAVIALLAHLRDPPWLIDVTSGLEPWRTDAAGVRYRPMGGRGSFFVRSDATSITVPVRAWFASPMDSPVTATFSIDDRPAERIVLQDGNWHAVTIELRRPTSRRVRRVDIHVDRTRHWNHGLDVGAVEVR